MVISINDAQRKILFEQKTSGGGFQSCFGKLQNNFDKETNTITLSGKCLTSILEIAYGNKYGRGGFQDDMKKILVQDTLIRKYFT
jgi:hypothetical protein